MTKGQRALISAGLAATTAAVCFGHHLWVKTGLAATAAARIQVEAPGKDLVELTKQAEQANTDLKKLRDEKDKLATNVAQCEQVFESQRTRLAELFRQLSKDIPAGWVLQRIEGTGREVTLHGVTMHPRQISALATDLAAELHPLGWEIDPAQQTAQNFADDGGPWKFELRLRDVVTATAPVVETNPFGPIPILRMSRSE